MHQENDLILSKLAVRLRITGTTSIIGSGIIYHARQLKNKIYIITSAHCLYVDGESFKNLREGVDIDIYDPCSKLYKTITHRINHDLILPDVEKDVAVLVIEKDELVAITGELPPIVCVKERQSINSFVVKGFPSATHGLELVCIFPTWAQAMTVANKFQLHLNEDYKGWATNGFSGSGVFLHANNHLYLYGIFTRYREENRGKVIYCQYIDTVNELLERNFLPLISFTFLGEHSLTPNFFNEHIKSAVKNLGPRFNERLNFRLPIAQRFHDIAKDSFFKKRLLGCIDEWLVANGHYHQSRENKYLATIEIEYTSLRESFRKAISQIGWNADQKIELAPFLARLNQLNQSIQGMRSNLQDKQWEEQRKEKGKEQPYNYRPPFENELSRLRELYDTNRQFINSLHDVDITLANFPYLLIDGEAGSGKSHLLGDIATERNTLGIPTLLLLGQLFKSGQTVWQNLLAQLGLTCSPIELLSALNNIGRQIKSRVLILIDALNEGAGKELWHNELAGFISEISRYPFLGLAVTVRSTYWSLIIPPNLIKDFHATQLTHKGFKDNEYAALKLFCEFYELRQPNFPILAPEFTNPLFLQLICEGVKASGMTTFPQGFQGIFAIFNYYIKAISQKLEIKREDYRLRSYLPEQAIKEVAQACFENNRSRVLPLFEALQLFDTKFPNHKFLLDDLILESVFIQSNYKDYNTDTEYEVIYFAYERFGDFIIAQQLLEEYASTEDVKKAFEKGNNLGKLIEEGFWYNGGILEAMAVLLPEKYNLEIADTYDWIYEEDQETLRWNIAEQLSRYQLESLKWRTSQSINNEKLTAWLQSEKSNFVYDDYLLLLTELTILPEHPFNSDRLHRIFKIRTMPERDSFWQLHLLYYNGTDDKGNGFPITRLTDWAWQPLISDKIDTETARLTGQTLAWVLATTNVGLRDRTTKALVNLLEDQPDALISILTSFADVDDMYIIERLYAVAYGCSLRTSNNGSLIKIAQYVFDNIFRDRNPPNHILLRDYARNTVEYAIYKKLPIDGDIMVIRPPYCSRMPEQMPSEEDVSKYKIDYDSPEYKQNYGHAIDQVHHSVMDWDFGRYIIDSALTDFTPVSFTVEKEYKTFLKSLKPKVRKYVGALALLYERVYPTKSQIENGIRNFGKDRFESLQKDFIQFYTEFEEILKSTLTEDQLKHLYEIFIPFFESIKRSKDRYGDSFDTLPTRCWIVQRVFELGYSAKLHGQFDSQRSNHFDRFDNKIERIGKKYQWIAFYEIMAMITDNYKVRERWSDNSRPQYYEGPWQLLLRDIDPAFTSRINFSEEKSVDELGITTSTTAWWLDNQYTYWNLPESTWATNTEDLPDPMHIIQRTDQTNQDWLYLRLNVTWKEPKPVGHDRYRIQRKDIWYLFQAYIITKKSKPKIIEWLKTQDFRGRRLPESSSESGLFNRENYWSPISKSYQKERKTWVRFGDSRHKVIIATSVAVGEMSDDKSGAHFRYDMPCQTIFEGMGLQYAPTDGEFKNHLGEVVVSNVNPNGVLIHKKDLIRFLDENNLEIVWVLLGEKRSYGGDNHSKNNFSTISGVYYMNDDRVEGSFTLSEDIW